MKKIYIFFIILLFSKNIFMMEDECDLWAQMEPGIESCDDIKNYTDYIKLESMFKYSFQDIDRFKSVVDFFIQENLSLSFNIPENKYPQALGNPIEIVHPPMYYAILSRDFLEVSYLLQKSSSINQKLEVNFLCSCPELKEEFPSKHPNREPLFSPLMFAAYQYNLFMVQMLVKNFEAYIWHHNYDGLTALDCVVYSDEKFGISEELNSLRFIVIDYLLMNGARVCLDSAEKVVDGRLNFLIENKDKIYSSRSSYIYDKKINFWLNQKTKLNLLKKNKERKACQDRLYGSRTNSKNISRSASRSVTPLKSRPMSRKSSSVDLRRS